MPIRPPFVKGGYYHIYNRGAGRQPISHGRRNYLYLLRLLQKVTVECGVSVIAYCLLPNHYHWLLRQDSDTPAGKVPARVFGSYTQAFNRAFDRSGTLFEGPYKLLPVETDDYLMRLCVYIHLNPVHHGLVDTPEKWPYSNYLDWIGRRQGTLIDRELVRVLFGTPGDYEAFVREALQTWDPETLQATAGLLEG
jgi:putative transposase